MSGRASRVSSASGRWPSPGGSSLRSLGDFFDPLEEQLAAVALSSPADMFMVAEGRRSVQAAYEQLEARKEEVRDMVQRAAETQKRHALHFFGTVSLANEVHEAVTNEYPETSAFYLIREQIGKIGTYVLGIDSRTLATIRLDETSRNIWIVLEDRVLENMPVFWMTTASADELQKFFLLKYDVEFTTGEWQSAINRLKASSAGDKPAKSGRLRTWSM